MELDRLYGLNPSKDNLYKLWAFVKNMDEINFEFLDMLYYQLSEDGNL